MATVTNIKTPFSPAIAKYDREKKIYDNKKSYMALLGVAIIIALIAIYFVWTTQPSPTTKTRVVYKDTIPVGYYDAYE